MSWKRAGELLDICHRGPEDTARRMWVTGRGRQRRKAATGGSWGEVWRPNTVSPQRGRGRLEDDGVQMNKNSPGLLGVPKLTASK